MRVTIILKFKSDIKNVSGAVRYKQQKLLHEFVNERLRLCGDYLA